MKVVMTMFHAPPTIKEDPMYNKRGALDGAFATVREMIGRAPFEHVEAYIDNLGLGREERAVLWLYAWCGGQAAELRELVTAGD